MMKILIFLCLLALGTTSEDSGTGRASFDVSSCTGEIALCRETGRYKYFTKDELRIMFFYGMGTDISPEENDRIRRKSRDERETLEEIQRNLVKTTFEENQARLTRRNQDYEWSKKWYQADLPIPKEGQPSMTRKGRITPREDPRVAEERKKNQQRLFKTGKTSD